LALRFEIVSNYFSKNRMPVFFLAPQWRVYELHKGRHLLIDCRNVSRDICLNDQLILEAMARGATRAGATVISQVRYHFGHNSAPGFTAMCLLDESHCSAHCYADLGLIALDVFTCGTTDPNDVLRYIREEVDLGDVSILEMPRFPIPNGQPALQEPAGHPEIAEQVIAL